MSTIASNSSVTEAAELAGPAGFDERAAAIGQPHARRAHFEITVMLEEVPVPVALAT
ncbi:hypothetical protein LGM65_32150 [Burkholderia anthina]|uniref:hypothetical protein n=1 Tax=Burkholderia anthina TaxID=179879 RepID=UPI001CF5A22B|nr:hypothetical protein [Burkholderia anthina]MCA8095465.1 hypothetical protein [Burkholderia anthina]